MYAYIDRKKKLPVTTLFRAIDLKETRISLRFDLAEEIKVSKTGLKNISVENWLLVY
jgi:DNA-directed RNA polymerase subunit beta